MLSTTECFLQAPAQKFFHFLACPEFLKFLNIKQEVVDKILGNDFCCGYMAAITTFFAILLFLFVLRFLFFLVFRTKRCTRITVTADDGDLIVSRSAIAAVIRKELDDFPQIELKKLQIFRKGKNYFMKIFCDFERNESGLPEIISKLKPRLKEVMKDLFGIDTITDITICIERLEQDDENPDKSGRSDTPQVYTPHVDSGL